MKGRLGVAAAFLTFTILQVLDVVSTHMGLNEGGVHEANPYMVGIVNGPLLPQFLLKIGFALVCWAGFDWAWRRQARRTQRTPHPVYLLPVLATLGLYSYIVTSNLRLAGVV